MSKKERVLLVNPNRMKPPVSPVALDHLDQSLREAGFRVDLLDLAFSSNVAADVKQAVGERPLLVGLTVRNVDDSYSASMDFCLEQTKKIINRVRSHTDSPIVLGGVGYSIFPLAVARYCEADLAVQREGEVPLSLLARRISRKEPYDDVPGLVFRSNGIYVSNRPYRHDLAKMALWQRRLVDNCRYYRDGGMVGFETKRGCYKACTYCADPLAKGRTVVVKPPKDVVRELKGLLDQGVDHFHTCDSEFNVPASHAEEVCREMIRAGIGKKARWYAYALPLPFPESLARLMKKAGCAGIDFSVDHVHPRILKTLGRDFTAEDILATARVCQKHGFSFMFDLLIGAPGEDRSTVRKLIEAMKRASPSRVGLSIGLRVYPNTKIARQIALEGMTPSNPSLFGAVENNPDLLKPIFYLSSKLGERPHDYIRDLVGNDPRFLIGETGDAPENYNYNDNSALVRAIRAGYRGAFWDIMRRVESRMGPQCSGDSG
jgi:radical SAM superfamily enzyme YgiQ (UPF0313 family)